MMTCKHNSGFMHCGRCEDEAENRALRRMLCLQRHGSKAYMDDGEASFGGSDEHPAVDYLRDNIDQIQDAFVKAGEMQIKMARLEYEAGRKTPRAAAYAALIGGV